MDTKNPQSAVVVENLSKTFKLPHEQASGIKQLVVNKFKGKKGYEVQTVLNDMSFEIKDGEFFGIVGRNGSGKSTLLKMLAGIYTPDTGAIKINGSLTPFIELGVGFNPELTGRENVFLNGALLGFSKKEMEKMYDDIVDFAELEKFMDQKLKNYSSGMQVRLAFSIAIKAESDVLLIDEVLAVGDAAFQRKCFDYFMKLKKEKKTVILVTHDMGAVRQYCDRAIMIDKGRIVHQGKVEKVAQAYQKLFNDELTNTPNKEPDDDKRWGTGKIKGQELKVTVTKDTVTLKSTYLVNEAIDAPVFGFNIYNSRGMNLLEGNTIREKVKTRDLKAKEKVTLTWEFPNVFAADTYSISVSSCDSSVTEYYDWYNEAAYFIVEREGNTAAVIDPPLTVEEVVYS
ncbi:MAG: tagH [Candidatus Saccharibacteria bacterium]|nr:tagH [Candidatus Saccharibacteria bacterium]